MRAGHSFCGRCGYELKLAASFCGNCGRSVPESAGQASGQPGAQDPSARPRRPGTPARRSAFPWPLIVALAVLAAGGGTAVTVLLVRHFHSQDAAPDNVAAISPTTAGPTSSSPPPAPTQVTLHGVTIGISAVSSDPDASAVAATLATYFGGIDNRAYRQAWDTYTSALQAAIAFQPFANALSTSQDSQVVVQSIQHGANGSIDADVSFRSKQAGQYGPSQGETCTNWSLDYHFVSAANATADPVGLSYLITKVTDIGAGHVSC
jgi:hypothetical protein